MRWVRKTVASTIGAKFIVALTGIVWVGFVIGHMLSNLQIFLGQDSLNNYAKMLHDTPALLWGARLVLILSCFAHIGRDRLS
jgi:succinate dehydrogenase / fumarate reductase cytochrome b subunit